MTLRTDLARLIDGSHDSTWASFDWVRSNAHLYGLSAVKAARWKTPGEPAFVSNLLEHPWSPGRLGGVIHRHLKPIGLSSGSPIVSGVFIHQKPKVQFQGYRGHVELGDLLVVRQHFRSKVAAPEGRAVLIQAKSTGKPGTGNLSGKEAQQFALYADWSKPFTFPHKEIGNPPDGTTRWNFKRGPAPYANSGVYGLVANTRGAPASFPDSCTWAVGYATPPGPGGGAGKPPAVNAAVSLAEALEGMLLGRWGRSWDAFPATTDHWSSFIVECLRAASTWSPYPIQRIGVSGATMRERRRDVLALVHSLAALPTSPPAGWNLPWHYRDEPEFRSRMARRLTSGWEQSLNDGNVGDEGGNEPPPRDADVAAGTPRGGPSVLYIATLGDEPLQQVDLPTDPSERPQSDRPQHPDAGSW